MKEYILIVEDESILYDRLSEKLKKENYLVSDYTPSVDDAITSINQKQPDLVLLDISLQGAKTGLDLGKMLHDDYNIPFIYVTQYGDDRTFYKGLQTNHEDFIVKTKPRLDIKELIRKIQTILHRRENNHSNKTKQGVLGLIGYLDEIKELNQGQVSRKPIKYDDIAYFTVKPFVNENEKEESLRANYLWFLTKDKEYYFLKSSLKDLLNHLPRNFVRVNESYIVNLSQDMFDGRINGSKLSILNQEIHINATYKDAVVKRIEQFYQV